MQTTVLEQQLKKKKEKKECQNKNQVRGNIESWSIYLGVHE